MSGPIDPGVGRDVEVEAQGRRVVFFSADPDAVAKAISALVESMSEEQQEQDRQDRRNRIRDIGQRLVDRNAGLMRRLAD